MCYKHMGAKTDGILLVTSYVMIPICLTYFFCWDVSLLYLNIKVFFPKKQFETIPHKDFKEL